MRISLWFNRKWKLNHRVRGRKVNINLRKEQGEEERERKEEKRERGREGKEGARKEKNKN